MTADKSDWHEEYSLNRRTALKAAGLAGTGLIGFSGSATARGPPGGPPGKSCEECPDGMEFLAKYKFECVETECIEEDSENGECLEYECVDWGFVLEKGDDLVDITYDAFDDTYNKDGEIAEPNFIEFEAEGYVIQHVCVYGGRDNDYGGDDGGLTEFASDLTNPGGQEAAISNIVFCGVEEELVFPTCPIYGTTSAEPTVINAIFADPDTGEIEEIQVGNITNDPTSPNYPNGLAFDDVNDVWWYTDSNGFLRTLSHDGTDFVEEDRGTITPGGEAVAGAAFWDAEEEYLFIEQGGDALRAAWLDNGSLETRVVVDSLPSEGIGLGDLAIDREANMLYVSTTTSTDTGASFFSVDLDDPSDTGGHTMIVESDDRVTYGVHRQIAFDDEGNLWAHNAETNEWQIIDVTDGTVGPVLAVTERYTDLARCGFADVGIEEIAPPNQG